MGMGMNVTAQYSEHLCRLAAPRPTEEREIGEVKETIARLTRPDDRGSCHDDAGSLPFRCGKHGLKEYGLQGISAPMYSIRYGMLMCNGIACATCDRLKGVPTTVMR